MEEPEGFRDFVTARSPALVRSAWLLTGDQHSAEDLVQATLTKVWTRWAQVVRQDAPEPYTRRVMLSLFLSWNRRRWRGEIPTESVPDALDMRDRFGDADVEWSVKRALGTLPVRQRAVVVLRYFDDMTEAQAAALLDCSVGTIKSQTFKALARLRQSPQLRDLFAEEPADDSH